MFVVFFSVSNTNRDDNWNYGGVTVLRKMNQKNRHLVYTTTQERSVAGNQEKINQHRPQIEE